MQTAWVELWTRKANIQSVEMDSSHQRNEAIIRHLTLRGNTALPTQGIRVR